MAHATRIDTKGRAVLPALLRAELGLRPGDTVVVRRSGDALLLESIDAVRGRIRERTKNARNDGGAVDRLIAERASDTERER